MVMHAQPWVHKACQGDSKLDRVTSMCFGRSDTAYLHGLRAYTLLVCRCNRTAVSRTPHQLDWRT